MELEFSRLGIPYAKSSGGEIFSAQEAEKKDGPFTCPACTKELTLKKGEVYSHHFAHKSGDAKCTHETVSHVLSKEIIQDYFLKRLGKEVTLKVQVFCDGGKPPEKITELSELVTECEENSYIYQDLRLPIYDTIELEYRWGELRIDVALIKNGEPVFFIESVVTHGMNRYKRAMLSEIPWIEVWGDTVCHYKEISPLVLRDFSLKGNFTCEFCSNPDKISYAAFHKSNEKTLRSSYQELLDMNFGLKPEYVKKAKECFSEVNFKFFTGKVIFVCVCPSCEEDIFILDLRKTKKNKELLFLRELSDKGIVFEESVETTRFFCQNCGDASYLSSNCDYLFASPTPRIHLNRIFN